MFLDLPSCLSSALVSQWLTVRAVTCVDAALCNRRNRAVWLELLCADSTVFFLPDIPEKDDWSRAITWFTARKAQLSDCVIRLRPAGEDIVAFQLFVTHCTKTLQCLEISFISATSMKQYFETCVPQLTSFTVTNKGRRNFRSLDVLFRNQILNFIAQCQLLRAIALPFALDKSFMEDGKLANLRSLEVADITADHVIAIATYCRRLRAVSLVDSVDDEMHVAIETMVTNCTELSMLSLHGVVVDDGILTLIAMHMGPRLTVLDLGYDEAHTMSAAGLNTLLHSCSNLRGLTMRGENVFHKNISAEVFRHCTNMLELDVTCLEDSHMVTIASFCPALRYLSTERRADSGKGLVRLLQECRNLRTLIMMEARDHGGWDVQRWRSTTMAFIESLYPHLEVQFKLPKRLPIWDEYMRQVLH